MCADRVDDAACRVACDDARRRCFAVARRSRIRADEDDDILHAVHAPTCGLEWYAQGDGEHSEFDLCDFHRNPPLIPLVYRILS